MNIYVQGLAQITSLFITKSFITKSQACNSVAYQYHTQAHHVTIYVKCSN